MTDYPEGYEGSQAAPPERRPEEDGVIELKPFEYWEQQMRDAVAWFIVEDEE